LTTNHTVQRVNALGRRLTSVDINKRVCISYWNGSSVLFFIVLLSVGVSGEYIHNNVDI